MLWGKVFIRGIRLVFIMNTLYLMFYGKVLLVGLLLGSLVLTFVPELFTRLTHIKLTMTQRVGYTIFIFATQWLGTYLRFYDFFVWWDIMLHFTSGILLGYVGVLFMFCIDKENMQKNNIKLSILMLFAFLTSVSGAVFWEIIEFLSDTFLGSNTQLGSLQDTMEDMIFGTLGAIVFIIYLYKIFYKNNSSLKQLRLINAAEKKDE